jgi:hypothetical protein
MPQAEPCSYASLALDIGYSLFDIGYSVSFRVQTLFGQGLIMRILDRPLAWATLKEARWADDTPHRPPGRSRVNQTRLGNNRIAFILPEW